MKNPFFAFYPEDFMGKTRRWPASARGHYIALLCDQWTNGPLPREVSELEYISPGISKDWHLLEERFEIRDGKLVNPRLEEERAKMLDKSQKARENAQKRWEKDTGASANAYADADANAYARDHASQSQSQNHSSETKPKPARKRFTPPTIPEITEYYTTVKKLDESWAKHCAEVFWNFYESKNWMVGKNKMSKWRSAATTALTWDRCKKPVAEHHDRSIYD